ncbi:hypothetical protein SAMN04515648_3190 [Phyllobacterium sp. CL33Tsu]|nr:hypothetical protein SAMN04515648_3190 [Phyllobacterium sp. CL33Tsu]
MERNTRSNRQVVAFSFFGFVLSNAGPAHYLALETAA